MTVFQTYFKLILPGFSKKGYPVTRKPTILLCSLGYSLFKQWVAPVQWVKNRKLPAYTHSTTSLFSLLTPLYFNFNFTYISSCIIYMLCFSCLFVCLFFSLSFFLSFSYIQYFSCNIFYQWSHFSEILFFLWVTCVTHSLILFCLL